MYNFDKNKEEQGLFKSIISASPDIVYIYNLTWNTFIYINERMEKNLGYSEYEVKDLGADAIATLIYPEDYPKYIEEIIPQYKMAVGTETIKYTLRLVHKDGRIKWFQFRDVISERKNDGTPRLVLGIVQDVTDQVNAQSKLKENEQKAIENEMKYRRLFDNAPVGMYWSSDSNQIILANTTCLNILGYDSVDDLQKIESTRDIYVNENDFIFFRKIIDDEGTIYNFETQMIKKDGEIITVLESANKIIEEDSGKLYYEGIIEDITKAKQDRTEIERLSKAITAAPVSVVITDKNGRIIYANPKFEKVSGYSLKELKGGNPKVLKSGKQDKNFYKNLWDTINNGGTWEGEFHNRRKNGDLYWEKAVITPIFDEKGIITSFLGIKEDITEKKAMLDEIIIAKEAAEKSDKLKSEFLAQVSHEIRTPLNSMIGFTTLINEAFDEIINDDLRYSFESIQRSGNRIIRTFDLILNMSQIQSNSYDFKSVILDINKEVLEPVFYEYQKKNEKTDVEIVFKDSIENIFIKGDQYSLNQIFSNLLDNSFKFTKEGKIEIKLYVKNSCVIVEINDTGIGIDKDFLPNIFDIFSQEEQGYTRSYDGNGLGLSLVKEYCHLNNIDINVESQKFVGTKVKLKFQKTILPQMLNSKENIKELNID